MRKCCYNNQIASRDTFLARCRALSPISKGEEWTLSFNSFFNFDCSTWWNWLGDTPFLECWESYCSGSEAEIIQATESYFSIEESRRSTLRNVLASQFDDWTDPSSLKRLSEQSLVSKLQQSFQIGTKIFNIRFVFCEFVMKSYDWAIIIVRYIQR